MTLQLKRRGIALDYGVKDYKTQAEIDDLTKKMLKPMYTVQVQAKTSIDKHRRLKIWLIENDMQLVDWMNLMIDYTIGQQTMIYVPD